MAPPARRQSSKSGSGEDPKNNHKAELKAQKAEKEKDQWVCLLHDNIFQIDPNGDGTEPSISKLRHPRTGLGTLFVISSDESMVFQLHNFKEKYRSWFIGNKVHSDGGLYLTSQVDPLFLILPYLMQSERFMTLDQLIHDDDFLDCGKLVKACNPDQVSLLSDRKDIDEDMKVFRFNKEKTLSWLKQKTEAVADSLEAKEVQVSSKGSHSSMFVSSHKARTSRESFMEFAHGIVSDFLSPSLEEDLRTYLGITVEKKGEKDSQIENEPPNKKVKLSGDIAPTDDYSLGVDLKKGKKNTKLTAAQKQLSKVDKTGMKSISSFFSAKS